MRRPFDSTRHSARKKRPRLEGKSGYLSRKKINHFCGRFSRGNVVVPVYQGADDLAGLQFIYPDGSKKFLTGTAIDGGYAVIDSEPSKVKGLRGNNPVVLVEGYSTGCSVRMATGWRVVVCFHAGNLEAVLDKLIKLAPDTDFIIASDNDHGLAVRRPDLGNVGMQAAQRAIARHAHVKHVWPDFGPDDVSCSDFNDLHAAQGLDAVRDALDLQLSQQASHKEADAPQASAANFRQNGEHSRDEASPSDDVVPDTAWRDEIKRAKNREGRPTVPLSLASNVSLILEHDPVWSGKLAYCDFSYRLIKRDNSMPDMQPGEWEDADTARLAIWFSRVYGFEPPRQKIADGLIAMAQRNRYHPVREYLNSLTWDQVPRIHKWLADVYESPTHGGYLELVGKYFLVGAVARVMRPGCKMDNVMILEGRQGLRKSTSVATLFGEWFSDAPIPIGEKDAYQNIQGVWCSELAELDSFNKAESNSAKMFFSQVRDRYRPSYGHCAQDFKRQTVFVGTTNQSEYLKDYSGNRRYWPVKCGTANIELLSEQRDQYWAEAVHRFNAGEQWWPDDDAVAIFDEVQDERMQLDPWQYPIEDWLNRQSSDYVTADDVIMSAIQKDTAQVTRADQNRISPIMKSLGWVNTRKRLVIGKETVQRHVYVRGDAG